mmetsp:Transcript_28611/g.42324  ORF Transcript_28611/g.42324 Transcript_28611/m.42324 type:complete len:127 (-) Transcript_28611:1204-1584(-)
MQGLRKHGELSKNACSDCFVPLISRKSLNATCSFPKRDFFLTSKNRKLGFYLFSLFELILLSVKVVQYAKSVCIHTDNFNVYFASAAVALKKVFVFRRKFICGTHSLMNERMQISFRLISCATNQV